MSKNWSTLLNDIDQPPLTVDEAIDRLLFLLEDSDKQAIVCMPKSELINLHFNLGLTIRNAWLNQIDSRLRAACGTFHPDDASRILIQRLWLRLQEDQNTHENQIHQ